METPVLVGLASVVLLVGVRHYAARRVMVRQGQFVWLMFVPTLIGGIVIPWAGLQILATAPLVGASMVIGGGIYLAVVVRFLTRLSRTVTSTGSEDDLGAAITEPFVDYLGTTVGLTLIGGVLAVVVLIAWGVSQAGR
jgi:hypothetical protein